MNTQRMAAILLIIVFASVMISTWVTPPGLYATQNIDKRLEILRTNKMRWLMERALIILYSLMTIIGFSLLASNMWTTGRSWISILGAAAIVAGTLVGLYFVYLQTMDPRGGYSRAYPIPENLAYCLWLAGTLLFGIAFLQAGLPVWLGYLTAGVAGIYGIVFLFIGTGFMTPFLLAVLDLVIGIVLLRQ